MLEKDYQKILILIRDVENKGAKLEETPVVNEFVDVFLNEQLKLPLEKEIEFYFNFVLGMQPISILLHEMTIAKLKKLKD